MAQFPNRRQPYPAEINPIQHRFYLPEFFLDFRIGERHSFTHSSAVTSPSVTVSWNGKQNQTISAMDALLDVYNPVPQGAAINRFWSSTSGNGPGAVKYVVPTIANGMVFIAGGAANYAPGPQGATGVNCSPAASGGSAPTCQGLLVVYGKLTP